VNKPLLEVKNLSIGFRQGNQVLSVVQNSSFTVGCGEIVSLVGESGCGKSVTCLALTRLLPEKAACYEQGEIIFRTAGKEHDLLQLNHRELRRIRGGKIAYIFQEPSVSLNPVFRIGDQIAEAVMLHRADAYNVEEIVLQLLADVGIPDPAGRMRCYPHELSGGMQQRVMIAMALAGEPELLVADEPTTALDVTIQAQILDLLKKLQRQRSMSIILVTHNLGIVAETADRVIVMYAGHTVEAAPTAELLKHPYHHYTKALLNAVPRFGRRGSVLASIPGNIPLPENFPAGCRFYDRCLHCRQFPPEKQQRCASEVPPWRQCGEGHFQRCFYPLTENTTQGME
jgi:oligopeptide/dipeptide ABC transporter ATP-binding protein